jgi:hypothetical protein
VPHARIPVELARDKRFASIPEKDRSDAFALYVALVLTSAELLLDGELSLPILVAIGQQIGHPVSPYGARKCNKIAALLCETGLLERNDRGTYTVTDWAEFHSTRTGVTDARKADAERKRRARQQPELPGLRGDVHNGRPANVHPGHEPDTRAHARPRQRQSQDQPRSEVKRQTEATRPAHANGALPIDKQRAVLSLLNKIGTDADDGTLAVLNSLAPQLPVGTLAKIEESLATARPKPRNRAAYAVAALQAERDAQHSAATLDTSVPHGTPRTS